MDISRLEKRLRPALTENEIHPQNTVAQGNSVPCTGSTVFDAVA